MKYMLLESYLWFFKLTILGRVLIDWKVYIPKLRKSDGATGARDLGAREKGWRKYWALIIGYLMHSPIGVVTCCWFVHDEVCRTGELADGRKVSNLVASCIIAIQLVFDGYKIEPITWFFATLFGAKDSETMKNGMFWVRGNR